MQGANARTTTRIRRSLVEYLVTYEELNNTLQRINAQGGRIVGLTNA
jgi:phycocyanin-associated rod linker protein